jgi:hypothetical protein
MWRYGAVDEERLSVSVSLSVSVAGSVAGSESGCFGFRAGSMWGQG